MARPNQSTRGEGGGRGTTTVHPAGTAELVVQLRPLRQEETRLDELGGWRGGSAYPSLTAWLVPSSSWKPPAFLEIKDEYLTEEGELTDKATFMPSRVRRQMRSASNSATMANTLNNNRPTGSVGSCTTPPKLSLT